MKAEWKERIKKHVTVAVRAVLFLCLFFLMIYVVNRTLTPNYLFSSTNPMTETYRGFYKMKKNTIDVLFLGSSHTASGFNPQDLYNEYGIRGYNLGSNSQNLWVSYYWLREALQYQSPKVVVLDCYMLFIDEKKNEGSSRLALDDMRWGAVKREAVEQICDLDDSQSKLSYLFRNIRFHTRWMGLNETDFMWADIAAPPELKGFWLYRGICGYPDYIPLTIQETGRDLFIPEAERYLERITALCRERGIELILVKTPTLAQTVERHNAIADYASVHHLKFLDYNVEELYHSMEFNYAQDMNDSSTDGNRNAHANPSGAKKLTMYLGSVLNEQCGLTAQKDEQWEQTREFNNGVWKDFKLHNETDIKSYLSMLGDKRYTIFIAAKDDAASSLNEECKELLRVLGLRADWSDAYRKSYFAVIERQKVLAEQMAGERIERMGSFRGGSVIYKVVSAGMECGNDCSIQINRGELAKRSRGLNIVVYSNDIKAVVDSVCFDTCAPELTAVR